jgi:sorting nexin-8
MSIVNFWLELPQPNLHDLAAAPTGLPSNAELSAKPPQRPATPPTQSIPTPKTRETRPRRESINDEDPWGSPALHKGHNHAAPQPAPAPQSIESITPQTNGSFEPAQRTTSNFTTVSVVDSTNGSREPPRESRPTANSLWYSFDGNSPTSYNSGLPTGLDPNAFGGGLGGDDPGRPPPISQSRALGGGSLLTANGVEENILVTLLPEKEGVFMFQHHNYQVHSPRRGSKVVRRYSDFVWLLDCLHKRYPFRRLPLLPPKRVGGA